MRRGARAIVVLAPLVVACLDPHEGDLPPPPDARHPCRGTFQLLVDDHVDQEWKDAVPWAVDQWSSLLGPAFKSRFEITTTMPATVDLPRNVVAFWPRAPSVQDNYASVIPTLDRDGCLVSADVNLRPALVGVSPSWRRAMALHEMGHVVGLGHELDATVSSVMIHDTQTPKIGCIDWKRACQLWDCYAPCELQTWVAGEL